VIVVKIIVQDVDQSNHSKRLEQVSIIDQDVRDVTPEVIAAKVEEAKAKMLQKMILTTITTHLRDVHGVPVVPELGLKVLHLAVLRARKRRLRLHRSHRDRQRDRQTHEQRQHRRTDSPLHGFTSRSFRAAST